MGNCELCAKIERLIKEGGETRGHTIAGMLKPMYLECDCETMETLIGFPGQEWETNPNGVIHGGIIATMIDTAIGITTIAITDTLTPTINLQISYLRPCPADGVLAVRSHITMLGGSVIHTRGEMFDTRDPATLIATAEGAFRRFRNAKSFEW